MALLFAATILLFLTCGRFVASYPTLACMPVDVIPVKRLHRIRCVILMFFTFIQLTDNRVGMSVCGKIETYNEVFLFTGSMENKMYGVSQWEVCLLFVFNGAEQKRKIRCVNITLLNIDMSMGL